MNNAIGNGWTDRFLSQDEVHDIAARYLSSLSLNGKRVLLIVPDGTRTAPIGLLFKTIHSLIGQSVQKLDVMIALGTHQPLSEEQLNARLEIGSAERYEKYGQVGFLNHSWDDAASLATIGTIHAREIRELSGGLFEMDVPVQINRRVFDYDLLLICGPVFPHEVVGFSGGNKYLFPGIGGPEILNFFHWLGAVISNPQIIGHKHTPVRAVVDRAAQMVPVPRACFCLVVHENELAGLYAGAPEAAWEKASDLSDKLHIVYKDKPFRSVLSCAPAMYDDLWTGGKCMYKIEPIVADGGEVIIYAPHITQVSVSHGDLIERIGYHTRDYFLAQWDQFKDLPWGILAHSTHVRGIGTFKNGVEKPRVQVTLATQIPEELCRRINLGYRDPATIDVESFAGREDEGVLLVRKAGEMLYRLNNTAV